ncbi:leucine-rich repeat-containing protein 27-like isoform X1 [Anthonomus grandis grandis]|uniref:leucine-rich repeat-containing protein 27-like isoform X1 n=1 Tax=Anthonomus grandis grandis TaxID=2921223 RepID=UPI002165E52F|nr:leucine-rich repeat-containing protein 27-like isoform X1 [Anthonomus grandis grandis]
MSSFEIISDYSKSSLKEIPENVLDMSNLKMLFLERNLLVALPEDFFLKLPNLMWLDLRNNQLESIPRCIAHHQHLEHLLLTNNNISKLPNELGSVSNLKALQIADNPLTYPPKKVIQEGTKSIKRFLKEQYELQCAKSAQMAEKLNNEREAILREATEKQKDAEMEEEKLLKIHEEGSLFSTTNCNSKASRDTLSKKVKSNGSQSKHILDQIQTKLSDPKGLSPTLRVKRIEQPSNVTKKTPEEEPLKIVHNVTKSDSKVLLKSYFNKTNVNKQELERIPENVLKDGWLNKLRILLNDQERILQQERATPFLSTSVEICDKIQIFMQDKCLPYQYRNLRAISTWRQQRPPATPKVFSANETRRRSSESQAPYATYPEYARMPSRSELAAQLQDFLREPEVNNTKPVQTSYLNLDKVINDLVQQLKDMEYNSDARSPRSEMQHASRQIETIVDIHKKLLHLKTQNDYL